MHTVFINNNDSHSNYSIRRENDRRRRFDEKTNWEDKLIFIDFGFLEIYRKKRYVVNFVVNFVIFCGENENWIRKIIFGVLNVSLNKTKKRNNF